MIGLLPSLIFLLGYSWGGSVFAKRAKEGGGGGIKICCKSTAKEGSTITISNR